MTSGDGRQSAGAPNAPTSPSAQGNSPEARTVPPEHISDREIVSGSTQLKQPMNQQEKRDESDDDEEDDRPMRPLEQHNTFGGPIVP